MMNRIDNKRGHFPLSPIKPRVDSKNNTLDFTPTKPSIWYCAPSVAGEETVGQSLATVNDGSEDVDLAS
ncbi:MAG TPA: hypothetical protein V6C72_14355 [Chroococcales cyanobacterium]